MSSYSEFFLNSKSSTVELDTLEITHSAFTQPYYIVRNAVDGVTVTLENSTQQAFEYYPLKVTGLGNREDLDFGLKIDLGDLGEVLPKELDSVAQADAYDEKPMVTYRTYRSDDLTSPLLGPLALEVTSFNFTREGSTFEAKAPSLNVNKTGEDYSFNRFPMLVGFL